MVNGTSSHSLNSEQPAGALPRLQELGYVFDSVLPDTAVWDFAPALYNQQPFLQLNPEPGLLPFYLIKRIWEQSHVQAVINFRVSGKSAVSLSGTPFGGVDFAEDLPAEMLSLFLAHVLIELRQQELNEITVKLPASAFLTRFAEEKAAFLANGFEVQLAEVNHYLPADEQLFLKKLHPSAKRRLNKLTRHQFLFSEEPAANADEVYAFIAACRREKGYYLSMSLDQLLEAVRLLPERYFFFSVRYNGELAAATICVRSSDGVLYNYAPAHAAAFDEFSPVILLTQGLVNWCAKMNLPFLDLGTSTLNDQPNKPLITFKERLGGIASQKLTLVKRLE